MKELRKLLRIQALRCHVIYCQNGTRLNVIPVTSSRSQALRYTLCIISVNGVVLSNLLTYNLVTTSWLDFGDFLHLSFI